MLPPKRRKIKPPHVPHNLAMTIKPAAHHESGKGAKVFLNPSSRRPAHAHELIQTHKPSATVLGHEAPELWESGDALDGPVQGGSLRV